MDDRPVFLIPLRPGEWGELMRVRPGEWEEWMRVGSTPGGTYRAEDFHRVVYRPEQMGWAIYDIDAPAGHELIGDAETLEVARQLVEIHAGVLMERAKAALSGPAGEAQEAGDYFGESEMIEWPHRKLEIFGKHKGCGGIVQCYVYPGGWGLQCDSCGDSIGFRKPNGRVPMKALRRFLAGGPVSLARPDVDAAWGRDGAV